MTRFVWYSAAYIWTTTKWSLVLASPILFGASAYFAFGGR